MEPGSLSDALKACMNFFLLVGFSSWLCFKLWTEQLYAFKNRYILTVFEFISKPRLLSVWENTILLFLFHQLPKV